MLIVIYMEVYVNCLQVVLLLIDSLLVSVECNRELLHHHIYCAEGLLHHFLSRLYIDVTVTVYYCAMPPEAIYNINSWVVILNDEQLLCKNVCGCVYSGTSL